MMCEACHKETDDANIVKILCTRRAQQGLVPGSMNVICCDGCMNRIQNQISNAKVVTGELV